MKRQLTQVVGSVLLTGALTGLVPSNALAQDRWHRRQERREEQVERQAERLDRQQERWELRRYRQLDWQRRLRYQSRGGNRIVGYYDRFGQFQAVGYYDRFGNFWRYR
ncbi:MAG: hypothetical protein HYR56_26115 [Acidobacteria bacterium]|nr:hypothetical protein [Acidobacteriota bacterium]MBI3427268.1 hypothetical protein [Acidobacteriota bacterium]